jgi:hypothetical protein
VSDWDAVVGEAALGLDLARVDLVRNVPAGRGGRSSELILPDPRRDRPAGLATAIPVGPGTQGQAAIFRQEALEFRARGRDTPGGVVRLGARWLRWGYWTTLALVVAAVAGVFVVRTDESVSGPAVLDGRTRTVAALLPASVGPDLASSRGITVTLPGGRSVRVVDLHAQLAGDTAIRKAGLAPLAQPAILVTGRLDRGMSAASAARLRTQVSVVLRSESLADVLGRQFGAMLSNGTAP